MAKPAKKSGSSSKSENSDRRCRKAWKQRKGVAPGAHNGHSIGGYSISKHGAENAAALAEQHTTPNAVRRVARAERRHLAEQAARAAEKAAERSDRRSKRPVAA